MAPSPGGQSLLWVEGESGSKPQFQKGGLLFVCNGTFVSMTVWCLNNFKIMAPNDLQVNLKIFFPGLSCAR